MLLHILANPHSRFLWLFMLFFIFSQPAQAKSNSAPVAIPDSYNVHGLLAVWAPGILGNDFDPDGDPITVQNPTNGSVTGTPHGSIITWSSGGFTYAPLFGYIGTDTFSYSVCDNHGACSNTTTVTFDVTNQPPSAASDNYTVHHTISVAAPGVLGNDSDPEGDTFLVENPSNGGVSATPHGYIQNWANGSFTYTAFYAFVGTDTFSYRVCDSLGACSTYATITFTVVNQPPSVNGESYNVFGTSIDVPLERGLLANDSDPESDNPILVQNPSGPEWAARRTELSGPGPTEVFLTFPV